MDDDSRLGELNRAFICEHSEVLKASKPIDVDGSLVTPTKERLQTYTFSFTAMMN